MWSLRPRAGCQRFTASRLGNSSARRHVALRCDDLFRPDRTEKPGASLQVGVIWGIPAKPRYRALQTNTTFESTSIGWSSSTWSNYAVITLLLLIGRRHMKFIVVNGRTPRPQSFCALCCEPIGESYLREIATRLSYCGHRCYVDHSNVPILALQNHARASWRF